MLNRKPSILRRLFFMFLGLGLGMGIVFPFYAQFFVEWKPGMYAWFFVGCVIAGASIGLANFALVKVILLRRLSQVSEVANSIGNRDLTHHCAIESDDVVGNIIDSFNQMTSNLRDIINKINTNSDRLGQAANEMDEVTERANAGTIEEQQKVQEVLVSMQTMSAMAEDVSHHTSATATSSQEADSQASKANQVVKEAMSAVNSLAETMSDAAQVSANLEKESKNIGGVLTVINDIAEQTNLLALNAAIEAARAGDQGRGFAVVADEVRTLATRTQSSTGEISQMIDRLQAGSHDAVKAMEQGHQQAQKGVEYTEMAVAALTEIANAVTNITSMTEQIAHASTEQNSLVESVNQHVDGINRVSQHSSDNVQKVLAASNEISAMAEELNHLVADFRV
ncbi:MAG: methyl-accepting chemotaxis protein [Gammaproteobacteria bacterium]|nr:methyl-accepting chemotaxis protein [Gammaproteobacteria bacterium]